MNKNTLVFGLLIVGAVLVGSQYVNFGGTLLKPEGPDMVTAFKKDANRSGVEAQKDAKQFGSLCNSLHDALASDWEQGTSHIKTGTEVDNLRIIARQVRTGGKSWLEHYPNLREVLSSHFEKHVGKSGGPLTDESKKGWLKAFKECADCSDYAAGQL
jgi:hypothetical protein